jgi:potassium-dependent mechanosensitive channel
MPTLRTFFATVLLGLSLCVGSLQAAEPLTAEAVQQSLDKIADRKLPDADQKPSKRCSSKTLAQLANKANTNRA